MDEQELLRLSQVDTAWSLVLEACQGPPETVSAARQRLLQRYSGAIYRYLLGILHDVHVADDLTRRFAARFLQGDLLTPDLRRARFRDAVKAALIKLYIEYQKEQQAPPQPAPGENIDLSALPGSFVDLDQEFLERWREELLSRAWEGLRTFQEQTGRPLYRMRLLRDKHSNLRSGGLAVQLSNCLGKSFTANDVRELLHDANEKFAELLLDEVVLSLEQPTREELHEELLDLRLLNECQSALDGWRISLAQN